MPETTDAVPGPTGVPLLGNTLQWARDPLGFHERLADYGRVASYEALGQERYLLTEPADIERVLTDTDTFPKHEASTEQLSEIVGSGLLTSDGALWDRQRAAIQPAFYMDHIKRYADVMVERTAATADRLDAGETVDVHAELTRTTLEILLDCMFGADIDFEERGLYDTVDAIQTPLQPNNQPVTLFAPDWLPVPMLRRAERARGELRETVTAILEDRRRTDEDRTDLLSMLLDSDTAMADEQVRDEMLTFLIAGHETTALTLTYTLDLLSRTPEAERRLHEELRTVVDGRPTIEDVFAFEYTEAVVKEAMRLYPPAYEIRREPSEPVVFGDFSVPEGSLLLLPVWVLHRDDRFWDAPEQFRPSRWLDGESDRPEFAYFPFGGGPRRCIGRQFAMTEAQLVLATLLDQWRFEREYDELELAAAVTLKPKTDVEMTVRRRG
ncbi:cytochrome P450 [Haloarcula sp. S1CR25-12]|uniref:Cytochrome P450 n=1 Tax=Haloarcula saliterrae TaxID=2950534 RepID=A0ABU2FCH4_9EURY|nr:cytochrome P450 [Haloarcula sp. S1CR25-12]MDS0259415.1 cytochrome P450 [Haloarcula sp. S1CR25-12]